MRPSTLHLLVGGAALLLATTAPARAAGEFPAASLTARLEAYMPRREGELRWGHLEHYALLRPVEQADLLRWIAPIAPRPDGDALVLAVGVTPELHGGAVLAFLFRYWRPEGRAAAAGDRFPFPGRDVSLGTIYAGHRRQIFLPVPGRAAEELRGALPDRPQLARMRFFAENEGIPTVERDAYSFLHLLALREDDFEATWRNHFQQELSVDLLLDHAWRYYLEQRSPEAERADHSNLHLVDVLLAYHHREAARPGPGRHDPNALKRRFLTTELARPLAEVDDESLVHYVESLGSLLADPHVTWEAREAEQVRGWLRRLSDERFTDLAAVEANHLAHLLHGLRAVRSSWSRLRGG